LVNKTQYIEKGTCIWCLKSKPKVTFYRKPHTITKSLGAKNIGFDICDSCNEYFGKVDKNLKFPIQIELAFKEIMNVIRLFLKNDFNENTYKSFSSIYFDYFHKERVFKIRKTFKSNPYFISNFTRQFKKGMYEVFFQEYHRNTLNGQDERFQKIRNFVRYDIGNLPLYYMESTGVYFAESNLDHLSFTYNENVLNEINSFGFYTMMIFGHIFFLEVTPRAELSRYVFLKEESRKYVGSGFIFRELKEMKYITDLDFTLRKLHTK